MRGVLLLLLNLLNNMNTKNVLALEAAVHAAYVEAVPPAYFRILLAVAQGPLPMGELCERAGTTKFSVVACDLVAGRWDMEMKTPRRKLYGLNQSGKRVLDLVLGVMERENASNQTPPPRA